MKLLTLRNTIIVTLVAAAAGGAWWAYQRQEAARPENKYRLQAVTRGDLVQSVSANGTLNPTSVVSVGTQVSGTVRKLHVDFNSKVEEGQVLLELDDRLLSATARQSAASIENIKTTVELTRANERRMSELLKKEYISRQEYDQSRQALKSAEAQLAQAIATADRDKVNLSYTVIRSPVSGIVTDRVVDVGQTVAASFQTPTLIKIARDLTSMQIDTSFAEADIGNIQVGQPARFTVDAFPSKSFRGEVKQIRLNPTNQQNVVTYNVVAKVDNPEQILLPGMTAYVNIVVARRKDVLQVPNAALRYTPPDAAKPEDKAPAGGPGGGNRKRQRDPGTGTVWVLESGALKPVTVQLGITDSRHTEITGGELKADDQVVVGEALPQAANGGNSGSGAPPTMRMRMF